MNLIEQIAKLVGFDVQAASRQDVLHLRETIDEGRRFKRAEDFTQALASFDRALEQAKTLQDKSAYVIINLHRADVLIKQKKWQEARALLDTLRHEAASQPVQLAYILCGLGTLEQAVGDWVAARKTYEQAIETARKARSAGAEGRAMGHLADTYLDEGNASYAVHLLRETLPKLNMSGDVELSSYFVGRLGEALIQTGHEAEGEQLLGRALRLADHMHNRAFQREWHLSTGRYALSRGQFGRAFTHYERALSFYTSDAPDYADILREMSKICLNLGKTDDALRYARRAVEVKPDDIRNQGTLGAVLRTLGQSADALPYLQAAAAANVEYDPAEGEILRSLAAAQADTGDIDGAVATYERARQLAHQNDDPIEEARAYRDLGQLYAQQSRLNDAIKTWMLALDIYTMLNQHTQIARLYCDIAGVRNFMGQGARAMKDYEQALMVLSSADDLETRGLVLSNAATAYVDQGDVETAEAFFSEAIKIAQRLNDKVAEATRRGNYGWFLMATGRAQRALSAMEFALKLSESLNLPLQIAVQTDNIGLAYSELGNHAQAVFQHRHALELLQNLGSKYWIASSQANLASALIKTGELDEAETLLATALATARSIENADVAIRALTGQARIALKRGDYEAAAEPIREAVVLARRANARRLLAEALIVQSERSARTDNPSRARELWDEAHKLLEMLQHPAAKTPPEWVK